MTLGGAGGLATRGSAFIPGRRVAIVGAGIAGLNGALVLQDAGISSTVYEASDRIGGRIYTVTDAVADGVTTEVGGEFIDSDHEEMLALADRFGLDLLDTQAESEADLVETYYFGGRVRTEDEVIAAFAPLAEKIAADQDAVEYDSYQSYNHLALELDRMPLNAYLHRIGAKGWIYDLLDVAYETEFGLSTSQQSALNLVFLIGTDLSDGFKEFGESDQRYKIAGGNAQVVQKIAAALTNPVQTNMALVGLYRQGNGYRLSFRRNGRSSTVVADVVVLAIPLTVLRDIELDVPIPMVQRRAIRDIGYGTNAKLVVGYDGRPWRDDGGNGLFFTDRLIQSGWDSSQVQDTEEGAITVFFGGARGLALASGTTAQQRDRALADLEAVFPGSRAHANGRAVRYLWPTNPWVRGSYSCFKPGQYTAYGSVFDAPAGNVYFAGEHCSVDFQGYMEGGAVTGRAAAEAIAGTAVSV